MISKERMLNAIECKEVDYIPCSFMIFFNLMEQCKTQKEFIAKELKMGLDAAVNVGMLEPSFHHDTLYREWVEEKNGNKYFMRRLDTPKGPLTQSVIQSYGWPSEGNFPICDDYIIPRSKEILVKPEEDLEKLKYLLGPFSRENIVKFKQEAQAAKELAEKYGLLQTGHYIGYARNWYKGPVGADLMSWLSGFQEIIELSLLNPDLIKEYINIIHEWNIKQLEIYLDISDVDLIVRRAWYETTEFWTPASYREIIAPTLKKEADLIHQAGKKFGYIITSAFWPLIDDILDSGIDVLIGLDPEEGKGSDIIKVKEKFAAKRKALWGGVSGAMTIEQGTERETEAAVVKAIETLGKGSGFILSPVDNVRENTENAWNNTQVFIDTWKTHRCMWKE
jgi:uroporphyrinogen-III decarboxylase